MNHLEALHTRIDGLQGQVDALMALALALSKTHPNPQQLLAAWAQMAPWAANYVPTDSPPYRKAHADFLAVLNPNLCHSGDATTPPVGP